MIFRKKQERSTMELIEGLAKVNSEILEDLQKKNEIIRGMQLQINLIDEKVNKINKQTQEDKP